MKKIKGLLDSIPLDKLPRAMREAVKSLRSKIDDFFRRSAPNSTPPEPPKVPKTGPEPPKVDKVRVGDVELPATTEMSVQDKLYRYLLDPEHPAGGIDTKDGGEGDQGHAQRRLPPGQAGGDDQPGEHDHGRGQGKEREPGGEGAGRFADDVGPHK
jgi:hypothetical protein